MKKILIILLILLILISGCALVEKECPKNVIPERVKLDRYNQPSIFYQLEKEFTWKDGAKLTNLATPRFYHGNQEGENINLAYSDGFGMEYYKKNIKPDGTIGKDTRLTVYLVINPEDKTEEGYKVIGHKCR